MKLTKIDFLFVAAFLILLIIAIYPYTKFAHYVDTDESNTISFLTTSLPIENTQGSVEAPYGRVAGYFDGTGDADDNKSTHIIGHNPGAFNEVLELEVGDRIKIIDRHHHIKSYTVYKLYDINDEGTDHQGIDRWSQLFYMNEEGVSLQTCLDDQWNRIVLAH